MDQAEYVQQRKRRYMAQALEEFERSVLPLIPVEHHRGAAVESFKATVRHRMNALATEAIEIMSLSGTELNGAALELRDSLSPIGRP